MPHAAVCTAVDAPLEVHDLVVEAPRAGEIRVKLGASGICASDISVASGALRAPLPSVLGHEGAGEVLEVGEGVPGLAAGDHVVLAAMPQCGECYRCARDQPGLCELGDQVMVTGGMPDGTTRLRNAGGDRVHQFVASGTFAEEIVVPAIAAVKIAADVPFGPASLIGCGVLTGAGAAMNTASIRAGDTVVVLGCGNVGLSAIQGARLKGAGQIIAVDLLASKLELAAQVGATTIVNGREEDILEVVAELTDGRGADVAIEAIGAQITIDQAIRMTGKGGEVVFVGAGGKDVRIDVPQFYALSGPAKTFKGCLFGSADIHRDVPRLVEAYRAGDLKLDELVTQTFALDDINDGLAALGGGDVVSAVIAFP